MSTGSGKGKGKGPFQGECRFCHKWGQRASRCRWKGEYMDNLRFSGGQKGNSGTCNVEEIPRDEEDSGHLESPEHRVGEHSGVLCSLERAPLECRSRFAPWCDLDSRCRSRRSLSVQD